LLRVQFTDKKPDVERERRGREADAFRDLRATGIRLRQRSDVDTERRGREADAFRDLRVTGIRASGFRSGARN
jgi:hypothetical protein